MEEEEEELESDDVDDELPSDDELVLAQTLPFAEPQPLGPHLMRFCQIKGPQKLPDETRINLS